MDWEDFKRGNKLLLSDVRNWLDGDLWPWLQCLSTIIFIAAILIAEPVGIYAIIIFIIWLVFNLYASYRTYLIEKEKFQ